MGVVVELFLPTPEVHASNTVIGNFKSIVVVL